MDDHGYMDHEKKTPMPTAHRNSNVTKVMNINLHATMNKQAMPNSFDLADYDYELPPENIAQHPAARRDQSRLAVLDCQTETITHKRFSDITDYLRPGDLLVVNDTRVFPARLPGRKATGGKAEVLLLHYPAPTPPDPSAAGWQSAEVLALIKSSKRPQPGSELFFGEDLRATVRELFDGGKAKIILHFPAPGGKTLADLLSRYGRTPLPPYIRRPQGDTDEDACRYQTRYAVQTGSVAAPTAGLHFSDALLKNIRQQGINIAAVTLHVGYGTFAPVRTEDIREHRIHEEYIEIPATTAQMVNQAKKSGRRIWAVGTTTVRTLEFAADESGQVRAWRGLCGLYIYPGFQFRVVDNLITNFHLPRSSLLFLVSALAGRQQIMRCYQEAIALGYRFFSYGDAMALMTRP